MITAMTKNVQDMMMDVHRMISNMHNTPRKTPRLDAMSDVHSPTEGIAATAVASAGFPRASTESAARAYEDHQVGYEEDATIEERERMRSE